MSHLSDGDPTRRELGDAYPDFTGPPPSNPSQSQKQRAGSPLKMFTLTSFLGYRAVWGKMENGSGDGGGGGIKDM